MPVGRIYLLAFVFAFAFVSMGARKNRKSGKNRKGTFIVRSLTKGAEIYVDDRFIGEVPMTKPKWIAAGVHTIRMAKPGHADYFDTFRVKRRKRTTLSIDLIAMSGILSLHTTPPGAMVLVDGEPLGRAPLDTDIRPGRRVLRVQAQGYESHESEFEVRAGKRYPVDIALVPTGSPLGLDADTWYGNPWVWVGLGAAMVLVGGVVAATSGGDDGVPEPLFVLRIETR